MQTRWKRYTLFFRFKRGPTKVLDFHSPNDDTAVDRALKLADTAHCRVTLWNANEEEILDSRFTDARMEMEREAPGRRGAFHPSVISLTDAGQVGLCARFSPHVRDW